MSDDKKKDPIASALGLSPISIIDTTPVIEVAPPIVELENQQYAKDQMRDAIETAQDALSEILEIAKQSQAPRAFEVVATLVTAITASSEKLAVLEMKHQDHVKRSTEPVGGQTVNNNLFVGNATELLRMLKSAQSKSSE